MQLFFMSYNQMQIFRISTFWQQRIFQLLVENYKGKLFDPALPSLAFQNIFTAFFCILNGKPQKM
jgi:hypothetical protein